MRTASTELYIKETCSQDRKHIDNFHDEDDQDLFCEAADMVKACLEASSPGVTIFEPLATFGDNESMRHGGAAQLSRALHLVQH